MKDYEMFKRSFINRFAEHYENNDTKIHTDVTYKTNMKLDGVSLVRNDESGVSPTFYIQKAYDAYCSLNQKYGQDTTDDTVIMNMVMDNVFREYDKMCNMTTGVTASDVIAQMQKENIILTLINTELNSEWLKTLPHRDYYDLSVIYKYIVHADNKSIQTLTITNSTFSGLNMTESELFELARENTRRILPLKITSLAETTADILRSNLENEEDEETKMLTRLMLQDIENNKEDGPVILGTERGIYGDYALLETDMIAELADKFGTNVVCLPSSTNEIIVMPILPTMCLAEINEHVCEVNHTQIAPDEVLSDSIYAYDRNKRELIRLP